MYTCPSIDQFRHKAVEQGQQQRGNMGTIHVRIRHDNDLVIAKLGNIKIISVSFGKSAAEGIDHGLDLRIGQHLVNAGLLHVQDLTADGKDGLIGTVSCRLGRAACRISLYDENLAFGSIPALTVGQLSVGIKGKFLLRQKIGLCTFLCFSDLGRLLRAADNASLRSPDSGQNTATISSPVTFASGFGSILVVKLGLGLSLKAGFRMLDGDDGSHTVSDICTGKVGIFFFQDPQSLGRRS